MAKRTHRISKSLKRLGEIQVNDWELPEILQKDISELHIGRSLRRLGQMRVTDWDFKDVIPAVNKLAQKEIDVAGFVRRTADYKINDWDLRGAFGSSTKTSGDEEVETFTATMSEFLRFTITSLIDQPKYLSIHSRTIAPQVVEFEAIMTRRDESMLIGVGGHTAMAIRNLVKAAASQRGLNALLKIQSHEEAASTRTR